MKIIIACFLPLNELPPVMTVLKVLSSRYDILYVGVDDDDESKRQLFGNRVTFINVIKRSLNTIDGIKHRWKRFIYRRIYYLELKRAKSVIESFYEKNDLVWVHHEYTILKMDALACPYCLTMYELAQDLLVNGDNKLKKRVKMSRKVAVPEYTRAAIVQACLGLKNLPEVIENKPFDYPEDSMCLDDNPIDKICQKVHSEGKKILVYSGIFLRERKLEPFIEAVNRLNDKWEMVLVGRESDYLHELIDQYNNVHYLGFFEPPKHLAVIRKADAGILTYVSDAGSINPVFCAPNKIFEYAKFGIPMICNDIPGLKFTVEYNHMGLCCDINSEESITKALREICDRYEEFSGNAYKFYDSVDISKKILNFVK